MRWVAKQPFNPPKLVVAEKKVEPKKETAMEETKDTKPEISLTAKGEERKRASRKELLPIMRLIRKLKDEGKTTPEICEILPKMGVVHPFNVQWTPHYVGHLSRQPLRKTENHKRRVAKPKEKPKAKPTGRKPKEKDIDIPITPKQPVDKYFSYATKPTSQKVFDDMKSIMSSPLTQELKCKIIKELAQSL